jgi:hypothetical protein
LFLEVKLRQRCAVQSLFSKTKALAKKEKKIPVLALATKGHPGFLVVVDSADLPKLVATYASANPPQFEEITYE